MSFGVSTKLPNAQPLSIDGLSLHTSLKYLHRLHRSQNYGPSCSFGHRNSRSPPPNLKTHQELLATNADAVLSTPRETHSYGPYLLQMLDLYSPHPGSAERAPPILLFLEAVPLAVTKFCLNCKASPAQTSTTSSHRSSVC
jgi:hypothetical protein